MKKVIRIGTRRSALAMIQTELVIKALQEFDHELVCETVPLVTKGDQILNIPLMEFGGKGAFVTEFEEAIKNGTIDIAVHSAKDMPIELMEGLEIAAVLKRADARDVLLTCTKELPECPVIGTSSLRRECQLKELYPNAVSKNIRGNVETRINKLRIKEYDGIILAAAGLERLSLLESEGLQFQFFPCESFIPAAGQAIIAVEGRKDDELADIMRGINDEISYQALETEREVLKLMNAGCHEMIGVYSTRKENQMELTILTETKQGTVRLTESAPCEDRLALAGRLVQRIKKPEGFVYFVGAGPGDPDLITVKGLHLLKMCDVVVYDRLASAELLTRVRKDCVQINVGKRVGDHPVTQNEINRILTEQARAGFTVVRLKGGDPFVFGRGGEEIEELKKEEIGYEVIPGITSAIAVPELAGIPVTHRGVSRSFHVITGHTKEEGDLEDSRFQQYAGLKGTLIFLMGMEKIEQIVKLLIQYGKSELTPAAVISNGSTDAQQTIRGTLQTIVQMGKQGGIKAPAIIVVGEVAEFDMRYHKEEISKCYIGFTGTRHMIEKMTQKLQGDLIVCKDLSFSKVVPYPNNTEFENAFCHLDQFDWIVFTSTNAVVFTFEKIKELKIDLRKLHAVRFAVIGSGTADTLASYGFYADYMPKVYSTNALAEGLVREVRGSEHVLIPRAQNGSADLTDILLKNNKSVTDIKIYCLEHDYEKRDILLNGVTQLDYLVFVSAEGVRGFFHELKRENYKFLEHVKYVCIGDVTQKELKKQVDNPGIVSTDYSADGIAEMIKKDLRFAKADRWESK